MNHEPSTLSIYSSREYGLFKMINGNRQLNAAKIKKIKTDIGKGIDVLKYCPVMVIEKDSRLEIIDGQHRFWVAKELKRPVHYIIAKEIDLYGIAKINSNTDKWRPKDFLNCYALQGNRDYQVLKDFLDDYELPLSVCLQLLSMGVVTDSGGSFVEQFQNGRFTIKDLDGAKSFGKLAKEFCAFKGWKTRTFLVAVDKILKSGKCDIELLIKKFQKEPEQLEVQSGAKEYLVALELIYNKGSHQRKVIY